MLPENRIDTDNLTVTEGVSHRREVNVPVLSLLMLVEAGFPCHHYGFSTAGDIQFFINV